MEKDKKVINQDSDFAKRRRIIKGLVATPVVYTLSNGRALALTSSHQCLVNNPQESQPDCVRTSSSPMQPDNQWLWHKVQKGTAPERWCVAHAEEDTGLTSYTVTGYDWRFTSNSGQFRHVFIDANGNNIVHSGNPLTASCATSFI